MCVWVCIANLDLDLFWLGLECFWYKCYDCKTKCRSPIRYFLQFSRVALITLFYFEHCFRKLWNGLIITNTELRLKYYILYKQNKPKHYKFTIKRSYGKLALNEVTPNSLIYSYSGKNTTANPNKFLLASRGKILLCICM